MNTLKLLSLITVIRIIIYIIYEYLFNLNSKYYTIFSEFDPNKYSNPLKIIYPLFHSGRTYIELLRESHFLNSISNENTLYVLDSIQIHPFILKPLNFYLFETPFSCTIKYFIIIALIDLLTSISLKYFINTIEYLDNSWKVTSKSADKFSIYYLLNPISIISNFCLNMDNLNYLLISFTLLVITHDTTTYDLTTIKSILGKKNRFLIDLGIEISHYWIFFSLLGFIYQINPNYNISIVLTLGYIMYRYRVDAILQALGYEKQRRIRLLYGITYILAFILHHYQLKTIANLIGGLKYFDNVSKGHFNLAHLPNLSLHWYIFLVIPRIFNKATRMLLNVRRANPAPPLDLPSPNSIQVWK